MWLGWLPFVALLIWLQNHVLRAPFPLAIGIAYLLTFMAFGTAYSFLLCPLCGRSFGYAFGGRWRSPFSSACSHCGTVLGQPLN